MEEIEINLRWILRVVGFIVIIALAAFLFNGSCFIPILGMGVLLLITVDTISRADNISFPSTNPEAQVWFDTDPMEEIRLTQRRVSDLPTDLPPQLIRIRPTPSQPQSDRLSGQKVSSHAVEAQNAAQGRDTFELQLADIGVIAFKADEKPALYRTTDIPDDIDFIQPFVQLRLFSNLLDSATAQIRFEFIDSDEQVLFAMKSKHNLKNGLNLITPPARLPIHDALAMDGAWQLRITVGERLLAVHRFYWGEPIMTETGGTLESDGEISDELRSLLAANQLEPLSLDELLGDSTDDADTQRHKG
jgi:hypothetical protein